MGFNQQNREHQLQISDTQIINAKSSTRPASNSFAKPATARRRARCQRFPRKAPSRMAGMRRVSSDTLDRYELQNYTSMSHGKHFLKFGARLRVTRDSNESRYGYNGSFNFGLRQNPIAREQHPG